MRKIKQIVRDPVLRRWLLGYLTRRWSASYSTRGHPPYLPVFDFQDIMDINIGWKATAYQSPKSPIDINLAGLNVHLEPGDEYKLIERKFFDTEQLLALHRFSWVTSVKHPELSSWIIAVYGVWKERYGQSEKGWAWHPYTVAERLLNLLYVFEIIGLPPPRGETLHFLFKHGTVIINNLEYFGEQQTGNHLANNGRGLYLAGLKLGLNYWTEFGEKILFEESERLFLKSGILREGSSHYHLLVTRWYVECWLVAETYNHSGKDKLREISKKIVSVLPLFDLPAGFPLIGDVSPDCSPNFLLGLLNAEKLGWLDALCDEQFVMLKKLLVTSKALSEKDLLTDGWLRKDIYKWKSIWHIAPTGWTPIPGHAHRDFGSFELHYGAKMIFRDCGRRSYGSAGDQDVAAERHNSLTVDGMEPYPVNRPYYSSKFRQNITGAKHEVFTSQDTVTISTEAFGRLKNVGKWTRSWNFSEKEVNITDIIDGTGCHKVQRFLHTSEHFIKVTGKPILNFQVGSLLLDSKSELKILSSDYWFAYGQTKPAKTIQISSTVSLPWVSTLTIKASPHND